MSESLDDVRAALKELAAADRRLHERQDTLQRTVEMLAHEIADLITASRQLITASQQDAENIRALARIAELHDRRLTDLEGGTE